MDRIHIRQLALNVIIGVRPRERKTPQTVILDLTLHADLRTAGRSDRLEHTIDYAALAARLRKAAAASHYRLLEALAERIAGLCLRDKLVALVDVTLTKPGALPGVGVAVTVRRAR